MANRKTKSTDNNQSSALPKEFSAENANVEDFVNTETISEDANVSKDNSNTPIKKTRKRTKKEITTESNQEDSFDSDDADNLLESDNDVTLSLEIVEEKKAKVKTEKVTKTKSSQSKAKEKEAMKKAKKDEKLAKKKEDDD